MNRLSYFLMISIIVGCISCTTEEPRTDSSPIYPRITCRSNSVEQSLPEGSQALFNAHGGLEIDQQILTYHNERWGDSDFSWNGTSASTELTALYPTLPGNDYSNSQLYTHGKLKDILISQVKLKQTGDIRLVFKHLFAQLRLEVSPEVQSHLKEVQVSVPIQVARINPENGNLTLSDNPTTAILSPDEDGNYSFLLPPATDYAIAFNITTDEGSQAYSLAPHTFESNYTYSCQLVQEEQGCGIYTVKDLIDFTRLMNGKEVQGRTLEDFGKSIQGKMVYQLKNDLSLNEEDCKQLLPIHYKENKYFNDVFEGNDHKIAHYQIPMHAPGSSNTYQNSAFFSRIGENGIVRNLHFEEAGSCPDGVPYSIAVVANVNKGLIDHCSVTNASLTFNRKDKQIGVICSNCIGTIINSWTEACTITLSSPKDEKYNIGCGGITGYLNGGKLLNCYSSDFTVNAIKAGKYEGKCGGLIAATTGSISFINCYSYFSSNIKNWMGAGIGQVAQRCIAQSFYYNQGNISNDKSDYLQANNCLNMKDDFTVGDKNTPVYQLLNQWIDNNASSYPAYLFRRWKPAANGKPVLE